MQTEELVGPGLLATEEVAVVVVTGVVVEVEEEEEEAAAAAALELGVRQVEIAEVAEGFAGDASAFGDSLLHLIE